MPVSQSTYHKFVKWFDTHTLMGGTVKNVTLDWDQITHPGNYVDYLFDTYRALPFEDVLAFSESEVTDNSMPNREVLEDASKIHMLRDAIRNNNLIFTPQLVYEPWYSRWRVHPGSGRAAAMWLEGYKNINGIYVHFQEPIFKDVDNIGDNIDSNIFLESIYMNKRVQADFEYYHAFPKVAVECAKTQRMDYEWHWHYVKTYRNWKFVRWSEGKNFLKHKYNWRSYAIDLWHELQ